MIVFVTVGSTEFDPLVRAVLQESVLESLKQKGFDSVVLQCGKSSLGTALEQAGEADPWRLHRHGMDIDIFRFKPTLEEEFRRADLVISHAGSGTILDVLRLGTEKKAKPLIVIPNPTLLHNHQAELAAALHAQNYLRGATVKTLARVIAEMDFNDLAPFPPFDGARFRAIMDDTMGFV